MMAPVAVIALVSRTGRAVPKSSSLDCSAWPLGRNTLLGLMSR